MLEVVQDENIKMKNLLGLYTERSKETHAKMHSYQTLVSKEGRKRREGENFGLRPTPMELDQTHGRAVTGPH